MTIPSSTVRVSYAGDGASVAFPTTFVFFGSAELNVALVLSSGVVSYLLLGTDYTVGGGNGATGTVTMTVAPPSGATLTIFRLTNRLQAIDFVANDALSAAALERGFDRSAALAAEDGEWITHTVRNPRVEGGLGELPSVAGRANQLLGFDAFGNPIAILRTLAPPFTQQITQPATGAFWTQDGAVVNRVNDRLLIGGATQSDAHYPPVVSDWLSAYMNQQSGYTNFTISGVMGCYTSPASTAQETVAATFAAQSLTSPNQYASTIAVEAFAVNNNPTYATDAWAFYGEARMTATSLGNAYGMELDTYSLKNTLNSYPYAQGSLIGLQLASGAGVQGIDVTASISGNTLTISATNLISIGSVIAIGNNVLGVGVAVGTTITGGSGSVWTVNTSQTVASERMVLTRQYNSSAAIQIEANVTSFSTGITFGSTSLVGADGVNGTGIAVAMGKGHSLCWFNSGNNLCNSISGTNTSPTLGTGISFNQNGLQITGPAADTLAYFYPVTNSANYLTFSAAVAGAQPVVAAAGSDANVNLVLKAQGTGNVNVSASGLSPAADNFSTLGSGTNRWSAVYAVNGVIQTSQASLKTNIQPLPAALPLVASISPVTYSWIDGGTDPVVSQVEVDEDVYETVMELMEHPEVQPDGSVHLVSTPITKRQQVFDQVPVTLPDGTPVVDRVRVRSKKGQDDTAPKFRDVPRMHAVPRKQKGTQSVVTHVTRPGQRTHWGFLAGDVQAAMATTGRDFAGYVKTKDGVEGLRPDQLVPVLWKAVQELAAEVAALKAKVAP